MDWRPCLWFGTHDYTNYRIYVQGKRNHYEIHLRTCKKNTTFAIVSENGGPDMQLKEYLFYKQMTKGEFAAIAGLHRQTLDNITNGKNVAFRSDIARKIMEFTGGKVTFEDLVNENEGKFPVHPDLKNE
jgi:DNA-binding XRE family transcriptional regulator